MIAKQYHLYDLFPYYSIIEFLRIWNSIVMMLSLYFSSHNQTPAFEILDQDYSLLILFHNHGYPHKYLYKIFLYILTKIRK